MVDNELLMREQEGIGGDWCELVCADLWKNKRWLSTQL